MNTPQTYKRTLVTAALLYANGPVHIGHLAGCYLPADIFVRYKRLCQADILFVSGSDEHGVPITIRAEKEGLTPQQVVDKYHTLIEQSFQGIGISFDIYSRTSKPIHYQTSSDFFLKLHKKNEFLVVESEQFFDQKAQRFLADRYIVGTCPKCGNPNAYGDQCEKCGTTLSPDELINPCSKLSDTPPIRKKTLHWYLPLDRHQKEWLQAWVLSKESSWKNNVFGQCKSWLEQGLNPRAVTRDLDWGVPLPLNIPEAKGKVLYVWFDAPIGYISATKELCELKGLDWKTYWQSPDTQLIHFIGKDNIVFHCLIFPAMLKAHGDYILPDNVPANEFMNLEGDKISTSRNWAVWLHEYLADFPNQQDTLRYVLCANMPENKDNDFTWKDFQAKNNNELVANLGNFINRAIVLTQQNFEAKVPPCYELQAIDNQLIESIKRFPAQIAQAIENYRFREALASVMELSSIGNKYLQDNAPWKLAKENTLESKQRMATVLHLALQLAANLSILLEPFLPFSSQKIREMLQLTPRLWAEAGRIDLLPPQQTIQNLGLLFEKIEDKAIEKQIQKLQNIKKQIKIAQHQPQPAKPEIQYEDFQKMDIRIATILHAEKVKGSKKILKLEVDTGIDKRTIASGIGEYFSPEEIIGKQVCVLVNLAPRKIMGIHSQGMLLMATNYDGSLAFIHPSKPLVNGGTVS
ncbi:MAG: methionine--tRNA ligase [Microscillaceae bacterium]|nr:methionine--tRNA ligase [Microscillaceae bacterium]MDW8460208.1 methionine--tRNA ligase [Cytophagales bacterium]